MELEDYARRSAREAAARNQNDLRMKTIKGMRAEQEALHQRRLDLQRASTVVESLTALKCFEIADLGQGHAAGGTAEHIRNRMNVLDRIKQRSAPLPPEQANDWDWFRKNGTRVGWNFCPKRDAWFGDTPSKTSPSACSPGSRTASTTPSAAGWLRSAETTCACLHCDVEQSPSEQGTCSAMVSKHPRMRGPALRC